MAAPIVYRWDDASAPIARGERRSLCDILYACLVTGYGAKPGAGWTRGFVNATFDKAVFRNNPVAGTGFYLQVDGLAHASAWISTLQGYEAMTSVDAGLFPFNATVQTIATSTTANTTARPWVLIADDKAFWFTCWTSLTAAPTNTISLSPSLFFGDLVKRLPSDAYACGLNTYQFGIITLSDTHVGAGVFSFDLKLPRKSSGAFGTSHVAALIKNGGPISAGPGMINTGIPWVAGDPVLISRPYVNDGSSYTIRGYMPGLYVPCHPLAFNQLATISTEGMNLLSIRAYANSGNDCNWFISLNDWRT